jgi:hypothetical protein
MKFSNFQILAAVYALTAIAFTVLALVVLSFCYDLLSDLFTIL